MMDSSDFVRISPFCRSANVNSVTWLMPIPVICTGTALALVVQFRQRASQRAGIRPLDLSMHYSLKSNFWKVQNWVSKREAWQLIFEHEKLSNMTTESKILIGSVMVLLYVPVLFWGVKRTFNSALSLYAPPTGESKAADKHLTGLKNASRDFIGTAREAALA
jgi:hypothetical protein